MLVRFIRDGFEVRAPLGLSFSRSFRFSSSSLLMLIEFH